jgi:hypothetical protein
VHTDILKVLHLLKLDSRPSEPLLRVYLRSVFPQSGERFLDYPRYFQLV